MQPLKVAIHGAGGRMGRRLVALGAADPELDIVGALDAEGHPDLGKDAGLAAGIQSLDLPITTDFPTPPDAVIDFSAPAGAENITARCREARIPLVMATTGLTEGQQKLIRDATDVIPVVWAPNMSLAVNLTMKLAEQAARALKDNPSGTDVEIIERHHRYKEDAPSGTALKFGDLIATIMGQDRHQHGRQGQTGKRPANEIGYHALRTGDNPGEHTIVFGLIGETVELTVRATNRDAYALGALAAAKFVTRQSPGHYTMYDVLGLNDS